MLYRLLTQSSPQRLHHLDSQTNSIFVGLMSSPIRYYYVGTVQIIGINTSLLSTRAVEFGIRTVDTRLMSLSDYIWLDTEAHHFDRTTSTVKEFVTSLTQVSSSYNTRLYLTKYIRMHVIKFLVVINSTPFLVPVTQLYG